MGPRNRRKLDKADLITEAAFVVVHMIAVNDGQRFTGLTNVNRAKVAALQSVAMTSQSAVKLSWQTRESVLTERDIP